MLTFLVVWFAVNIVGFLCLTLLRVCKSQNYDFGSSGLGGLGFQGSAEVLPRGCSVVLGFGVLCATRFGLLLG